jgi:hypothetical protein
MIIQELKDSSNLRQFRFEIEAWIRLIEFLNTENTYYKTRLSQVIDQIQDKENLAMAEHFQNQYIIKDDVYDHFLFSLKEHLQKWKEVQLMKIKEANEEFIKIQKNLRTRIEFVEKDQMVISKDFNTFLIAMSLKNL